MAFILGQGILGRVAFPDGENPEYDRTYLVVGVNTSYIEVLNVSSIRGKERKLAFPTNERINNAYPPFNKPSFVKLDSLTRIPSSDYSNFHVLAGGRPLNNTDLTRIIALI